jgi:hypothetical protein
MPRYVVLYHDCPQGSHYDLMLEWGDALKTWSLAIPPQADRPIDCKSLPDHRQAYLDYEGPVSGNRGSVHRWDAGICDIREHDSTRWSVDLHGDELTGRLTLTQHPDNVPHWTLLYLQGDAP